MSVTTTDAASVAASFQRHLQRQQKMFKFQFPVVELVVCMWSARGEQMFRISVTRGWNKKWPKFPKTLPKM